MNETSNSLKNHNTIVESATRSVSNVINSIRTLEGEGFVVRRPFPSNSISDFDPFLLLDEMGPMDLAPREAKGAPDHPHIHIEVLKLSHICLKVDLNIKTHMVMQESSIQE